MKEVVKACARGRLARIGVALALTAFTALAALAVVPASPASAWTCHKTYWYDDVEAQIDNCPGTGQSWAFIWDGTPASERSVGQYAQVVVWFYNGTKATCAATQGWPNPAGACTYWSDDIWKFQVQLGNNRGNWWSQMQYM